MIDARLLATRAFGNAFLLTLVIIWLTLTAGAKALAQTAQSQTASNGRERLLMDFDWRFALGHARDPSRDFDPANNLSAYLAKIGTAGSAAAADFDDHGWRTLNLPHDWAVELPFNQGGSVSHGCKAIGRYFPENSVGWYRKTFLVPLGNDNVTESSN